MEKSLVSVDPYKAFVDNYYTFFLKSEHYCNLFHSNTPKKRG